MKKDKFLEAICRDARHRQLWQRGDRILAAVSGGPDSLGLLLALSELAEREGLTVGCCCVNHQLRPSSAQEAAYVQSVCAGLKIPCRIQKVDVRKAQEKNGGSLETVARILRYEALRQVMKEDGWNLLATAHHADDQAETVLYHVLRGSGLTGLRGMLPKNGALIRPFLNVRKVDIFRFLGEYPVTPCQDESNDVPGCTRNRIRLELLPELETYNPEITQALCRMAETAADEDLWLETAAARLMKDCVQPAGETFLLKLREFRQMMTAMQRRVIRGVFRKFFEGDIVPDFQTVERFRHLLEEGRTGQCTSGCGVLAVMQYDEAIFHPGSTRNKKVESFAGHEEAEESGPAVRMGDWMMDREYRENPPEKLMKNQCLLDADKTDGLVTLRGRRPGDRFCPRGMEGSKSLKKWMIDMKIPKEKRDDWPLAADSSQIYWICGLRKSRLAMPDEKTKRYLLLTVRRV